MVLLPLSPHLTATLTVHAGGTAPDNRAEPTSAAAESVRPSKLHKAWPEATLVQVRESVLPTCAAASDSNSAISPTLGGHGTPMAALERQGGTGQPLSGSGQKEEAPERDTGVQQISGGERSEQGVEPGQHAASRATWDGCHGRQVGAVEVQLSIGSTKATTILGASH